MPNTTEERPREAAPPRRKKRRGRRLLIVVGTAFAVLACVLLVVRETVGWVFQVTSGSMAPTIGVGDWVFVRYGTREPERHDIIVIAEPDGGATVKRVAAVGPERIRIDEAGDLWIKDGRLPFDSGRPDLVPVFDSSVQSIGEHWRMGPFGGSRSFSPGRARFEPWSRTTAAGPNEVWRLDGIVIPRKSKLGMMHYRQRVDDGWVEPDGSVHPGKTLVHDVAVEFEAKVPDGGGIVKVELTEQGDIFSAYLVVFAETDTCDVYIDRETIPGPDAEEYPMRSGKVVVPIGEWFHIRFSNVDNKLRFELDGQAVVRDYGDRNTRHPQSPDGRPFSPGERVHLGAWMTQLEIKNVKVLRDLHYVPRGTFGVGRAVDLDADQVFVLGDASSVSRDSRERGPIDKKNIVGRVEAVVWPLARARRL